MLACGPVQDKGLLPYPGTIFILELDTLLLPLFQQCHQSFLSKRKEPTQRNKAVSVNLSSQYLTLTYRLSKSLSILIKDIEVILCTEEFTGNQNGIQSRKESLIDTHEKGLNVMLYGPTHLCNFLFLVSLWSLYAWIRLAGNLSKCVCA